MAKHYLKFASKADLEVFVRHLRGCCLGADPGDGLLTACSAFIRAEEVTVDGGQESYRSCELFSDPAALTREHEFVPLLRALAAWMGEDVGRDLLPAEEGLIAAFAALPEQWIEVAYSKPAKGAPR